MLIITFQPVLTYVNKISSALARSSVAAATQGASGQRSCACRAV
jgi:hypothetical protein